MCSSLSTAFEAMGRFGKDVLKLISDISQADWVREQWGKDRYLSDRAVTAQYRAQLMQRLSTCLVQFSYQRCVLHRARLALPW